jgi:hypothetical protein
VEGAALHAVEERDDRTSFKDRKLDHPQRILMAIPAPASKDRRDATVASRIGKRPAPRKLDFAVTKRHHGYQRISPGF